MSPPYPSGRSNNHVQRVGGAQAVEKPLVRFWRLRVPPVVLGALAITALFSALVFYASEVVFTQTVTLQQQLAGLMEARVNAFQMHQDVKTAEAAQWAYLSTRQEEPAREMQQSSRQASLHFGLLQGLLNTHPSLKDQALPLGLALQAQIDGMNEILQAARQGQVDQALASAQSNIARSRASITMAYGIHLDQALVDAVNALHGDISRTLSRQRTGTAVLVGLNLLFLSALAVRAIRHFYDQEKQRVQLSSQAARLEAAVHQRTNELNDLSTYLQRQSEREKANLARELHDELGALLTAAKLDVAWLQGRNPGTDPPRTERLDQLSHALDQALNIKRRVMENLHPSLLTHLGLGPALIWYVQQTCDNAGLTHHVKVPDDALDVDPEVSLALYRIVQEALNNTIRHACAHEVSVTLEEHDGSCILHIQDDGTGIINFRPDQLSHGMAGMRHRALAIGGRFAVSSRPGQGTGIEVHVPCKPASVDAENEAHAGASSISQSHAKPEPHDIRPCVTA